MRLVQSKAKRHAVGWLCVAISAAMPIAVVILIVRTTVPMPVWDEWEWAELIYHMHVGTLTLAELWRQHLEHRVLFVSLIVLGLDRLGGWNTLREELLSVVLIVFTQIGLIRLLIRSASQNIALVASIAVSIFLYGLWQWENLVAGIDFSWFVCNAAVVWVVVLLTGSRRSSKDILIAGVLCVVASYTEAQGLLAWIVGAICLALIPRNLAWTLLPWLVGMTLAWTLYQLGSVYLPNDTYHVAILRQPIMIFRYVCADLGSPLLSWKGFRWSEIAGFLGSLAFVAFLVRDLLSTSQLSRMVRVAPWYSLGFFAIATAFATATGRLGFGLDQALASRYTTVSSFLWISIIGLVVTRWSAANWFLQIAIKQPRMAFASGPIVCLLGMTVIASEMHGWMGWQLREATLATVSAEMTRSDFSNFALIYPDRDRLKMLLSELRRIDDGPFVREDDLRRSQTKGAH